MFPVQVRMLHVAPVMIWHRSWRAGGRSTCPLVVTLDIIILMGANVCLSSGSGTPEAAPPHFTDCLNDRPGQIYDRQPC